MARDRFHGAVRRALEKDGWLVTADPYIVRFDRTTVEIDLAAEQLLAAERAGTEDCRRGEELSGSVSDVRFSPGTRPVPDLPAGDRTPRTLSASSTWQYLWMRTSKSFCGPMVRRIMHQYHVHLLVFDPIRRGHQGMGQS